MHSFETWIHAAGIVMQWQNLLLIFGIGIFGIIIGFLPGIGAPIAMTLFIPLTFGMSPGPALIILAVIYMSTIYGGSISSILLNTPGTPASAATCLDGYPMAKQGKGGIAIGISMMSSFVGGFIGLIGLIFLSPVIADFALKFQPAEYFMLALLGLILISASAKGSMLKSFIAGAFGLIASSVGMELMTAHARFTFGTIYLKGGLPLVPVLIGIFAFSEVFFMVTQSQKTIAEKGELAGSFTEGLIEPWRYIKTLIRASLIGLGIGTIPGEGAVVANFTAYLTEQRASRRPEDFGTGMPQGVIAPEASNNACVAGALIPTLTLGIPGGGVAAIFMGGIMIHGLNPGFELYTRHLDVLYTLFFGLIVANFIIFICCTILAKFAAKVTIVPVNILAPAITVLGITSTYLIRSSTTDVMVAIIMGILGYFMRIGGYNSVSFLVAFILAPIAEKSFFQALMLADNSYWTFVRRPLSAIFLITAVLVIVLPPILKKTKKKDSTTA